MLQFAYNTALGLIGKSIASSSSLVLISLMLDSIIVQALMGVIITNLRQFSSGFDESSGLDPGCA